MTCRGTLAIALALLASPVAAQEAGEPPLPYMSPSDLANAIPDQPRHQQPTGQTLPLTATRRLRFETSRGTWISLDRSPDGRRIVFDLLGDLYTMPVGGGRASRISGGLPFDAQPTYSPDGKSLAFVSDRSGAENLWVSRADGSHPRQVTFGDDDTALTSPAWTPNGKTLFVSRYRPDLNNYELWRHELAGGGTLVIPIRDKPNAPRSEWRSTLGAVISPDGRYLYAARKVGELDFEEVDNWIIIRRNLASGQEVTVVAEPDGPRSALDPGAFFRPVLSPDGSQLAYGRRRAGQTELRLRDLKTGTDRRLASEIDRDQIQASMWQDILPRYAFTADGRAILISVRGSIQRLSLQNLAAAEISFTAPVDLAVGPSTRQDIREETGPLHARLIMAPIASPDGRSLGFSALGRLYVMPLDGRSPPLEFAPGGDPAFQPSWSADGKRLVWVRWSERRGGAVWTAPLDGSVPPSRLTDVPAYYSYPVFTPDGQSVLALRSAQQARLDRYMEYGLRREASLVSLPLAGGRARILTSGKLGGRPQFTHRPGTTYILADDGLNAVDLGSGDRTMVTAVKGPGWYFQDGAVPVDDIRISPDGKWLLVAVAQQLHLVAVPATGTTIDLSDPRLPHRRITDAGADYFEWAADGTTISWSTGRTFHTTPLADIELNAANAPNWTADPRSSRQQDHVVTVTAARAASAGSLLLRNARVLPMTNGDPVIEHGDILVTDGRFAAIGPTGSLPLPAATFVRDMTGKTILPGFIDAHDHIASVRRDVLGLEEWGLRARLAFGVTTSFDPSSLTVDLLAYQDLLDAGLMTGPRLRQTGIALFSMQRFTSLPQVLAVLGRYRDDYGLRNIKEYRTGNRRVRQWVAQGARIMGLQPTTEGALSMKLDLSQIIDGYAGNEHALVASPLQNDVLTLLKFARTSYTTTLEITNGGPPGQDWSIANDDPHDNTKLRHFWPEVALDQVTLRRPWRRLQEYKFPSIAADAAALQAGGGLVGMGSHGEMPGIGFHYEMEAHAIGGMKPMAILHAATIGSAETIGRKADLGSIEPGKLADLVILDRDPRKDIRNARAVTQVMVDGRLFDAETLDETWPVAVAMPPAWFNGDTRTDQWLPTGERQ